MRFLVHLGRRILKKGSLYFLLSVSYCLPALIGNVVAQCVNPPAGLVNWWPADGDARDIIGHHDGTIQGGVTFAPGMVEQAFNFNGVDGEVRADPSPIVNNFTVEFWINPTEPHQIDIESTSGLEGTRPGKKYALFPGQGDHHWGPGHAGAGVSVGTNGVSVYEHATFYMPALLVWSGSLTGWTHIAVVYRNKQPSLYINGALVRTGLVSPKEFIHPGSDMSDGIGGGAYGHFRGPIDELSIYSRPLSIDEIQAIFNAGSAGKCKPTTILYGIDISEVPSDSDWDRIIERFDPQFVIADAWGGRNPFPAEAILSGAPPGLFKAAYCFLNFDIPDQDGAWQVQQAIEAVGTEIGNIAFMAIDVESRWLGRESQAERVRRIHEAVRAVQAAGLRPIMYSSYYKWREVTGDNSEFTNLPLWVARDDGTDDLDLNLDPPEPWWTFGGWTTRVGKQYRLDVPFDGMSIRGVDLDIFELSQFLR